jgi:hypothetical protein
MYISLCYQKKSTVQQFRSLRFQGHNYHEDGKRINFNFPHSAKTFFWQRANIENKSQILYIVVNMVKVTQCLGMHGA